MIYLCFKKGYLKRITLWLVTTIFLLSFFLFIPLVRADQNDSLRATLKKKMDEIQGQINQYNNKVQKAQQQAKTLQRQLDILDAQMGTLKLRIRQTELNMEDLNISIGEKNKEIEVTEAKLGEKRKLLGEYIRAIYQYNQENLLEIILKQENFSDFFEVINSLQSIEAKISVVFEAIKSVKTELEMQKAALQNDLDDQTQLNNLQTNQKISLERQGKEKSKLLTTTHGQENKFQQLTQKAQSDIAVIRNQLFLLDNVGISMTFERAYQYASAAAAKTGIRPAFLLAVLKNESSWGTKVGTGTWRKDMASRDHQAFLNITKELGLDPDSTPVSKKPWYGWGGAMGPAQFLPSVWLLVKEEVAQLTGHTPPNPWDIGDAFMAAAVKLTRAGADSQTYDAEWKSAMIYFAGGNWNKAKYRFYGDAVMEMAGDLQGQIDMIK